MLVQERAINVVIGENIKRYMLEQGISKYSLKKKAKIDGKHLNAVLNGEKGLTTKKLQEIAWALEIKTLELLEDWSE